MSPISLRNAWNTILAVDATRQKVGLFLEQNRMRVISNANDCYQAQQDVPFSAGVQANSWMDFPKRAYIQIRSAGIGTYVDATMDDASLGAEPLPEVKEQRELVLKNLMWNLYNLLPTDQPAAAPVQSQAPIQSQVPVQSQQGQMNPTQLYPSSWSSPQDQGQQGQGYTPVPVQQVYNPPVYGQPTKDRSTGLLLEILPDLFGFYGFGWIYGGNTSTGIAWLVGGLIWDVIAIIIATFTGGIALFCTLPVNILLIVLSATGLDKYMKSHPEIFKL